MLFQFCVYVSQFMFISHNYIVYINSQFIQYLAVFFFFRTEKVTIILIQINEIYNV